MKKIVVDARMLKSSGIGTYLQNMIPNLIKNFKLVLVGNPREIETFSWGSGTDIINFNAPIYSISEQLILPLKVTGCDIFLSPHYNIPLLPVKAKKRAVIIHDVYHLAFYGRLTGFQKLYAKTMINSAVKRSDIVLTVSEFSKSEILKYTNIHESKIKVVYCGLNTDLFKDTFRGKYSSIKEKYRLPDSFFLFVSNIKPHKNLYNLLTAFKEILQRDESRKLVIVGEYKKLITSDRDVFKLIDSSELLKRNTLFTGYISRSELNALYRMAYALIFPSLYEGFGLPPVEAMICGCPVLASTAASVPEACGNAAVYFDPYNANDIKNKLENFISDEDERKILVEKGYLNIKKFTWEKFSEKLNIVLESS